MILFDLIRNYCGRLPLRGKPFHGDNCIICLEKYCPAVKEWEAEQKKLRGRIAESTPLNGKG